ncbi:MAG: hypothetical protein RI998_558 [Pseudomonadota bacterium]|jgi:hypothetical protein
MAASSNSDDASDIFWPGYVDAVTNLAINLLFVIAVMSIVVIGAVLQLSKMKPSAEAAPQQTDKPQRSALSKTRELQASEQALLNLQAQAKAAQLSQSPAAPLLQQAAQALAASVRQQRLLAQEMAKMQASIGGLEGCLAGLKSPDRPQPSQGPSTQEIHARDKVLLPVPGSNQVQSNNAGVVVVFERDVIELSSDENALLIRIMREGGPLDNTKWELRVAAQQGFSEAIRIAFYRLTSVRNTLIQNGVPADNIDMRVLEVASGSANNNRVQVRRLPGS